LFGCIKPCERKYQKRLKLQLFAAMNISLLLQDVIHVHRLRLLPVSEKYLPPELLALRNLLQSSESPFRPLPAEGLSLLGAFAKIDDPALRGCLIELVERLANSYGNFSAASGG
jgi:hypothetical protein